MTSHVTRQRLGSVGDSAPPSDSSEASGSETFEIVPEWSMLDTTTMTSNDATAAIDQSSHYHHQQSRQPNMHLMMHQQQQQQLAEQEQDDDLHLHEQLHQFDSLSLENSGILTDAERTQVESFFSGLGTEVGV